MIKAFIRNESGQKVVDGTVHADDRLEFVTSNSGGTDYKTSNSGTATLVNGQTSIVVTHGLGFTPVAGDIMVTPMESLAAASEFYIDTYTATQFTIHVDINPTQDVDFAWKAVVL